jgi:hypothetical protein
MVVRDSVLEGYSLVGKILKEELETKQLSGAGFGAAGVTPTTPPVTSPAKVATTIAESDKNLSVTGASFLAGGTAALTDSIVNRLGKGVHLEGLNPEFASKFASMAQDYSKISGGNKLSITDAFRSREEQARLFAMKPNLAAPPGRSRHEKGMAIDMDSAQANQLFSSGLMEKHGFYRPMYPPWGGGPGRKSEPWHLEMAKSQVGDAYPSVRMSSKDIARHQVGDAFAGADMVASAANSGAASLKGALGGFGKDQGAILVNITNILSKAVSSASSNKGGTGGSQTDPMLQNILTGNFG